MQVGLLMNRLKPDLTTLYLSPNKYMNSLELIATLQVYEEDYEFLSQQKSEISFFISFACKNLIKICT